MSPVWFLITLIHVASKINLVSSQNEDPIVETNFGVLRGLTDQDRFNRSYDVFLGVPFAQPPVGSLRWQFPDRPPESWSGIRNATEFAPHCIQIIADLYRFIGLGRNDSEDCLYLNIYIPGSVDEALVDPLPVMVYLYGGAYLVGSAEMYPGQELATDGRVIVVTAAYRVSVMGFFSTGDAAAPGNYALWDIKAALEWINDNIAYFGGDTSRITLIGQSSAMAEHCMISPQTNTLFQRVIALSASVNTGNGYNPDPKRNAQLLADLYFCNTTDSYEIVSCLMEKDAKHLDTWALIAINRNESRIPNFMPVIDGTFVIQDTRKSFEEGIGKDIDLMTGRCFDDGAGLMLSNPLGRPPLINITIDPNVDNEAVMEIFMTLLGFYDNADELYMMLYEHNPDINSTDDETCSRAATQLFTDIVFEAGAHYDALKHAESKGNGSTYLYQFRYRQSFLTGYPDWVNGSHIDDVYSVLGDPFMKVYRILYMDLYEFSPEDEAVGRMIRSYYANFAYTGNPNQGPHDVPLLWPQYDPEDRHYLIESIQPWIEQETPEFIDEMNWCLYEFWPLLRPAWDKNNTETQPPDVASSERFQEPINEEDIAAALDNLRESLFKYVNWDDDLMEAIDERIASAIEDREMYRTTF